VKEGEMDLSDWEKVAKNTASGSGMETMTEYNIRIAQENAVLKKQLAHEQAKNFQYEAEKATPGYLLERAEQAESRLERLREAIKKHREFKLIGMFESELLPSDRELYEILEEEESESK